MIDSSSPLAKAASRPEVMAALRDAAKATGADFSYLVRTAQRESNFDTTAKAPTSTATGLFQFTNDTWLRMVDRYGAQHGLAAEAAAVKVDGDTVTVGKGMTRDQILDLRNDPELAARMAGELAQENAKILEKKIGRAPTSAELYAAHFMGPTDAAHLIQGARRDDAGPASKIFHSAALANPNVFSGKDGQQLTAAQLYVKLTGDPVTDVDAGNVTPAAFSLPDMPTTPTEALLAARSGVAQLTSTLMAALFDVQSKSDKA
ncbi:MAG: hypothetical protein GC155_00040 [Alphaproteobacteria bacterium]|nr:hypothetical protein [Alphaproteobacteria bacterium]